MNIKINTKETRIRSEDYETLRLEAGKAMDRLWSNEPDELLTDGGLGQKMTGWVKAPVEFDEAELERILDIADIIKNEAELLVVIGIGGSYLGAKAAIEALPKYEAGIPVKFMGNNLCSDYYGELIEEIKKKNTMICIISKSGNTMEARTAFEIVKPIMAQKYGSEEEAAKRILAITDPQKGSLREEASKKGYVTLDVPGDMGGRYSVLSAVGLLPMAVSGIDIRELLAGAAEMANSPEWDLDACDYAITRHLLQQKGKEVEFLEMTHSGLNYLGEWIKQLFGESEGKKGGGLLPANLMFSTDLHSMGQYLQQGRQNFMETLFVIDEPMMKMDIPAGPQAGKTVAELNNIMIQAVVKAHRSAGIPIVEIHLPKLDAYNYGQLLYFLEMTCAITAILDGLNPFDQPGVEAYKAEMRKLC